MKAIRSAIHRKQYRNALLMAMTVFILVSFIAIDTQWKKQNYTYTSMSLMQNSKYILKPLGNFVAVYEVKNQTDISPNPIMITQIYLNTLPEYDQQSIKIGMYIKDDMALTQILEDLES